MKNTNTSTSTMALDFAKNYSDVSELMCALDDEGLEASQDFDAGATTWYFPDESQIVICESEVEVK